MGIVGPNDWVEKFEMRFRAAPVAALAALTVRSSSSACANNGSARQPSIRLIFRSMSFPFACTIFAQYLINRPVVTPEHRVRGLPKFSSYQKDIRSFRNIQQKTMIAFARLVSIRFPVTAT